MSYVCVECEPRTPRDMSRFFGTGSCVGCRNIDTVRSVPEDERKGRKMDTEYVVMQRKDFEETYGRAPVLLGTDHGFPWLVLNPYGSPVDAFLTFEEANKSAESRSKYAREHCAACGGLNPGDATHARC